MIMVGCKRKKLLNMKFCIFIMEKILLDLYSMENYLIMNIQITILQKYYTMIKKCADINMIMMGM